MNYKIKNQKLLPKDTNSIEDITYLKHWIELDAQALEDNAQQFKEWLGPTTQIAAIIKSNAYGHGIIEIAQLYEQSKSIAAVCVVNLSEAITLREQAQVKKPIFVVSYLDRHYAYIIKYNIEVVVYDMHTAQELNKFGKKYKKQIKVHIKCDTGMSRLGITPSEIEMFIEQLTHLPWIIISGIFSHLAESYQQERTAVQQAAFEQIQKLGYQTHISNSHGALTVQNKNHHFARIGIGLFGYIQKESLENQKKLKPVLSLKTKILQIKSVPAGTSIGYDGMFQASKHMTIATIALGYYEGLDARLSNIGFVIINDQFAPIVGRVCMNLTIVDVTTVSHCFVGQTVTVLGKEDTCSISVYDWSHLTKASVYNHLTKLSATIPRFIIK